MAASRSSLVLVGLLVACLCATANAGRVAPVEAASMKLAGLPKVVVVIELEVAIVGFIPTERVLVVVENAAGEQAVFELVRGVVTRVEVLRVAVGLSTDPLQVRIAVAALGIDQVIDVPLEGLNPALAAVGAITGPVKAVLTVVKNAAGALEVLGFADALLATLGA